MTHRKPGSAFFVDVDSDIEIGIQIENDQYRKYLRAPNAESGINALIQKGLFFSRDYRSPRKKELYLNYGKVFKYQYQKMTGGVALNILLRSINEELKQEVIGKVSQIRELLGIAI